MVGLGGRGRVGAGLDGVGACSSSEDKVAVRLFVMGGAGPGADVQALLIEIFRVDKGRLAETWGITEGPDPRR
ncbi:hypothetical protein GCM10022254_55800 [Actinomadura meridiana]|uniref:Uncharacterized protein n=1 Tax=Actinomadura meridiana TaxID=559626 RepID=A0ABP8CFM7_9ACTN